MATQTVQQILDLKKIDHRASGKDLLIKCLNPEHEDSNPSMRVDSTNGMYHCFSCGHKGNLFKLYNISPNLGKIKKSKLLDSIVQKRSELVGLNIPEKATPFYRDYRGIKKETFAKFKAFEYHKDELVGRIVFPIYNYSKKIIALLGRAESDLVKPKYLIYPRKTKMPLYPMATPINGCVILVEGIFDMLNLHDKGLTNAICIFGTDNFSSDKLAILKLLGITCVDIFMDSDEAGMNATDKIALICEEHNMDFRRVTMHNYEDPGSLPENVVLQLREKLYAI